jgi:hypothetical protein
MTGECPLTASSDGCYQVKTTGQFMTRRWRSHHICIKRVSSFLSLERAKLDKYNLTEQKECEGAPDGYAYYIPANESCPLRAITVPGTREHRHVRNQVDTSLPLTNIIAAYNDFPCQDSARVPFSEEEASFYPLLNASEHGCGAYGPVFNHSIEPIDKVSLQTFLEQNVVGSRDILNLPRFIELYGRTPVYLFQEHRHYFPKAECREINFTTFLNKTEQLMKDSDSIHKMNYYILVNGMLLGLVFIFYLVSMAETLSWTIKYKKLKLLGDVLCFVVSLLTTIQGHFMDAQREIVVSYLDETLGDIISNECVHPSLLLVFEDVKTKYIRSTVTLFGMNVPLILVSYVALVTLMLEMGLKISDQLNWQPEIEKVLKPYKRTSTQQIEL